MDEKLPELKKIIECLFFVSSTPLGLERLVEVTGSDADSILAVINELVEAHQDSGIGLRRIAGGWQFFTDPIYLPYIEKLYKPKVQHVSRAGMETLAVIAYRQPVTKAEIEEIRQVQVDGVLSTLLEKRLIKEVGRRETPGRPILYGTTEEFLALFGLNGLDDLPSMQ